MAKKSNQFLRTSRDYFSRKKMNDGKGWTNQLFTQLKKGEKTERSKKKIKAVGNRHVD